MVVEFSDGFGLFFVQKETKSFLGQIIGLNFSGFHEKIEEHNDFSSQN